MAEPLARILVVGSTPAFCQLFDYVETTNRYLFYYVTGAESILSAYPIFDVVCFMFPKRNRPKRQHCRRGKKIGQGVPVVMISPREDTRACLAAMNRGPFDYLTCYTPLAEVNRILGNAVRCRKRELLLAASA